MYSKYKQMLSILTLKELANHDYSNAKMIIIMGKMLKKRRDSDIKITVNELSVKISQMFRSTKFTKQK